MNKAHLVARLASRLQLPRAQASEAVETMFESVAAGIAEDGKVVIANFGSFRITVRKARTGTSPSTGEPISIPECITVTFRPAPKLRNKLNPKVVSRKAATKRPPASSSRKRAPKSEDAVLKGA